MDSQGFNSQHKEDLRYLVGTSYLKFGMGKEITLHSVEPYFDPMFDGKDTLEQRLECLFGLKDRWTLGELDSLLGEFLEPGAKLAIVVGKITRQVKDASPFGRDKAPVYYYLKKF